MVPRWKRVGVGIAVLLALLGAVTLPGPIGFAVGMVLALVLPSALEPRVGACLPSAEGVQLVTGPSAADRAYRFVRVLGIVAWALYGVVAPWYPQQLSALLVEIGFVGLCGTGAALTMLAGRLVTARLHAETITLERTTLTVDGPDGARVLPYARLQPVEVTGHLLWLGTDDERFAVTVGGGFAEALAIAERIEEARRRVPAEGDLTRELGRPAGMGAREWLLRLDALAATRRDPRAFRASALDEPSLWAVLADEAADVEVRAGAARVLGAGGPTEVRARVASTLASADARARIAVSLVEDVDTAAAELDALDDASLRRLAGM